MIHSYFQYPFTYLFIFNLVQCLQVYELSIESRPWQIDSTEGVAKNSWGCGPLFISRLIINRLLIQEGSEIPTWVETHPMKSSWVICLQDLGRKSFQHLILELILWKFLYFILFYHCIATVVEILMRLHQDLYFYV